MTLLTTYYKTPIGTVNITGNENGIQAITFINEDIADSIKIPVCLKNCVQQLKEYFAGTRTVFNLKLNPQGTAFQKRVWQELLKTPYNTTKTYADQSRELGNIKAIRAVASANGKNPIAIVIPCHRIIGSDGSLTGYAGGIWRKKWLLNHENPIQQQSLF